MKPRLPERTLIEDGRTLFVVTRGELTEYAEKYAIWLEFEGDTVSTRDAQSDDKAVDFLMAAFGMKK